MSYFPSFSQSYILSLCPSLCMLLDVKRMKQWVVWLSFILTSSPANSYILMFYI